jgi:glycosyltransferase involved in cell wall biosynthesis
VGILMKNDNIKIDSKLMKISVINPTRKRAKLIATATDSLINNADCVSRIEFIFRFDDDDKGTMYETMQYYDVEIKSITTINHEFRWGHSTYRLYEGFSETHNAVMKFIIGIRHGYIFINRYNDEQMHVCTGEYIVLMTDDIELTNLKGIENKITKQKHPGWDTLIREAEGQHYILFFKINNKSRWPVVLPKKFFEINGRLCPNVLDDYWYDELCKALPAGTKVVLDWNAVHNCLFRTSREDVTAREGRGHFDKTRNKGVEGYELYNEEEMMNINKFLEENPNHKKTSQYHDDAISKLPFSKGGISGRWC